MADYSEIVNAHEGFLAESLSKRDKIIHGLYLLAEELSEVDVEETNCWVGTVLDAIDYLKGVEQHGD